MKRTTSTKTPILQRLPFARPKPGGATAAARRRRLRALVGKTLVRREGRPVSAVRVCLGGGTAFILAALLCVHLLPNRVALRLDEVAPRDVLAPRTVRYEDTEATRRLRAEAARQVDKRYSVIENATAEAMDAVSTAFDRIDAAAASGVPKLATAYPLPLSLVDRDRAAAADVRAVAHIAIPVESVAVLRKQNSSARALARAVAVQMVGAAMERAITEETGELSDARALLTRSDDLKRLPTPEVRRAVAVLAGAALFPNRRLDRKETDKQIQTAEASVAPQVRRVSAGEAVIRAGERVRQQHLDAFAALGLQNARPDTATVGAIVLLVFLLVGLASVYLHRFHADLYRDTPRLLLLSLLTVFSVLGLKIGSALLGISIPGVPFVYLGMMCVASAGMVIALLLSPRVATLIVALLSVASGLILNNELRYTLITLGSSLAGIVSVTALKNRNDLLRAILFVCGTNALLNVLAGQLEGDLPRELLLGTFWGVISGVFAVALFYFGVAAFEKPFGITTHLRLLELSDPATPVLQEFRMRVPGTYAHSLMVSNLAHAAAEAIGCDALMIRVAAYYHDLGKMNRPEFFIENQSNAENIHDRLSPSMSAIILASHVKEGLEMAEELGLPPRVREIMAQHHGTTLMKYFYHRATGGLSDPQLEAQFRYAGPKPQSKEAAILMIADSVEAASRTLTKPTPQRVADFVASIVEDKRSDGQLDECDLTLRDLTIVQASMVRTLSGALHARVEYPGKTGAVRPDALPKESQTPGSLPTLPRSLSEPPPGFPVMPPSVLVGDEPAPAQFGARSEEEHGTDSTNSEGSVVAAHDACPASRAKTARARRQTERRN